VRRFAPVLRLSVSLHLIAMVDAGSCAATATHRAMTMASSASYARVGGARAGQSAMGQAAGLLSRIGLPR
jgi:hypothetical protein